MATCTAAKPEGWLVPATGAESSELAGVASIVPSCFTHAVKGFTANQGGSSC